MKSDATFFVFEVFLILIILPGRTMDTVLPNPLRKIRFAVDA